jgi:glycosyltransferase involved in cell wall biosynthesis
MKIGVMLRNFGEKGGIVVYAKNLLNSLLRIDSLNEYVMIYRNPEDLGNFTQFPNVAEKIVSAPNKLFWDQIAVPLFARKENLDIIYNPKLSIPLITSRKTVWVMHGGAQFVVPQAFKWSDRLYFKIANRLYAKKATAIITMTKIGANDIVKYMGADPNKMHVIHEAYNEQCKMLSKEQTQPIREKYSLPEKFILFVGGLTPLKNFGNLLRAYQMIQDSIPHKLVVVGFKRWKFLNDLRLIDQLGLNNKVIFTGFALDEEIPAFYNLADLFMFPSLYEGFGIPVLEAMACGCPVITSETGCSPEVAGNAAILIDPYNPEQIAGVIKKVLTDSEEKNRLIEKGLNRVKQFSWKNCAEDTLTLFNSLFN